jgi:hypothetical protein
MRTIIYLILISTFAACMAPVPLTRNEKFIKGKFEEYKEKEFKNSSQFNIFSNYIQGSPDIRYLEMTGFIGKEGKVLVIGVGYNYGATITGNVITYNYLTEQIVLTSEETAILIDKINELKSKVEKNKLSKNETRYFDYAINKDLIISCSIKLGQNSPVVSFWIKGKKALITEQTLNNISIKLNDFSKQVRN